MATTVPFTLSGSLNYPPNGGEVAASRPFTLASSFKSKVEFEYEFTGSGTKTVDFGSIDTTGVKAMLVEVEPDSSPAAQPIMVTLNGGSEAIEVSPGGFIVLASPNPTSSGILSMSLAYTSAATVKVFLLG